MRYKVIVAIGLAIAGLAVAPTAWERTQFQPLRPDTVVNKIVVEKTRHVMTLFRDGTALKSYRIALGPVGVGPKQFEGDDRTPEGQYTIDFRKPDSSCHLALHISYPSTEDNAFAAAQGRAAGGAIMIHGLRNGLGFLGPLHRAYDWTAGCVAVTNREMDELWRVVPDGTPIELRP